ncbi:MAG: DUF3365 domain-containing protein [Myxococcales bacterium]|nr:DUF3365 domain-containing protein [Myxococcales bacterium]
MIRPCLGGALKGRFASAMKDAGAEGALEACTAEAQVITSQAATPGLRVGRTSLRLRNPKNAEAPEWVNAWLVEVGERKASGVPGVETVVEGIARVLIPLEVGGLCLTCHGDSGA